MQVPEINSGPLDAIPVNSLVRFRGMVIFFFGQLLLKCIDYVLKLCNLRDHVVEDLLVFLEYIESELSSDVILVFSQLLLWRWSRVIFAEQILSVSFCIRCKTCLTLNITLELTRQASTTDISLVQLLMIIRDFVSCVCFQILEGLNCYHHLQDQGVWHTSKYMDTADVPSGPEAEPQMWDRRLLYCVPVC